MRISGSASGDTRSRWSHVTEETSLVGLYHCGSQHPFRSISRSLVIVPVHFISGIVRPIAENQLVFAPATACSESRMSGYETCSCWSVWTWACSELAKEIYPEVREDPLTSPDNRWPTAKVTDTFTNLPFLGIFITVPDSLSPSNRETSCPASTSLSLYFLISPVKTNLNQNPNHNKPKFLRPTLKMARPYTKNKAARSATVAMVMATDKMHAPSTRSRATFTTPKPIKLAVP